MVEGVVGDGVYASSSASRARGPRGSMLHDRPFGDVVFRGPSVYCVDHHKSLVVKYCPQVVAGLRGGWDRHRDISGV